MRFLPHKFNFRCFLEGKTIKFGSNSWEIPTFPSKSLNFQFCMGRIPPPGTTQNQNFDELTVFWQRALPYAPKTSKIPPTIASGLSTLRYFHERSRIGPDLAWAVVYLTGEGPRRAHRHIMYFLSPLPQFSNFIIFQISLKSTFSRNQSQVTTGTGLFCMSTTYGASPLEFGTRPRGRLSRSLHFCRYVVRILNL